MMKRLLLVALLCLTSGAAWAQCAPLPYTLTNGTVADANQVMGNFNAVNACAQSGTPLVATNAAMAALLTSSVPNGGIVRLGFAVKGDAPPLVYLPENGTCAANGRINDGASCVNTTSGDGNSFYTTPVRGLDLREFGVKFDNGTDNSTALQAAFTWAATANANNAIICPSGPAARFGTAVVATFATTTSALAFEGAGRDLCVLSYTGSGGTTAITVNYNATSGKQNSIHLKDFTLCTTGVNVANGLLVSEAAATGGQIAQSDITNVSLRGCDGYGVAQYWTTGITMASVSNVNYYGLLIVGSSAAGVGGTGVAITGTGPVLAFQHNFVTANMNNVGTGITFGADVQGVTVSGGSNFTGVNIGIATTSGTGEDQLTVVGNQFNCLSGCIVSQSSHVFVSNNYFIIGANSAAGIRLQASHAFTISGNAYFNGGGFTGTVGEEIDGELVPGTITGNVYENIGNSRVYPNAGNYYDNVSGNSYPGTPAVVAFGGALVMTDQPASVAIIVACAANIEGRTQEFNTNTASPAWNSTVTGGGATHVGARCNGTNWVVYSN